jgi:hypothetical protein
VMPEPAPPRCSGPMDHHVAVPGGRAGLRGALGYVGDVADAARRGSPGMAWVRTKTGIPSWWSPYHRPACSQVRRPAMTARVVISSVNTWLFGPGSSGRQLT